ncbi:MAG TPA: helix-turn-helix transcriptional regulator [Alphaproteobacteria bacterium]|nr:helix-turn-helix transcriptional regulator [Alphaproteobacteria bacterium]
MSKIQTILDKDGNEAFVVLPKSDYEELVSALEDAEDLAKAALAAEQEYVPFEHTKRMLAGEHPLRVWRTYRGLKQAELARRAGISAQTISMIETGERTGSVDNLVRLARVLDVDLDDLVVVEDK